MIDKLTKHGLPTSYANLLKEESLVLVVKSALETGRPNSKASAICNISGRAAYDYRWFRHNYQPPPIRWRVRQFCQR